MKKKMKEKKKQSNCSSVYQCQWPYLGTLQKVMNKMSETYFTDMGEGDGLLQLELNEG